VGTGRPDRRLAPARSALALAAVLAAASGAVAQDRPGGRRAAAPPPPAPVVQAPEGPRRAGTIRIETRVAVPAGAQLAEIWIATPRVEGPQVVADPQQSAPANGTVLQQQDPGSGNTYLRLRVDNPKTEIAFSASWSVERGEQAKGRFRRGSNRDLPPDGTTVFARELAAHELAPLSARIRAKALAIAPGETDGLNAARAIYEEVVRSLAFSTAKDGPGRGDVLWACDAGHGNATDFAALFVTLARARGIPARFLMGVPLPEARADQEVEIPASTAWAEFFVQDLGWIPVDPANAKTRPENRQYCFGNLDERRILFTAGRDVQLAPPSKRGPHNLFIYPYAEIDGEPVPVNHRFVFKEK
jgi:transglutaminase-like putative cysteine protease